MSVDPWTNAANLGAKIRDTFRPLVICGHGVSIRVDHGSLKVTHGFAHYLQEREILTVFPGKHRTSARIIVLDASGNITFDAIGWLGERGIPLIHLNWNCEIVSVVVGRHGLPIDRQRAVEQARLKSDASATMAVNRTLILDKLSGCAETLQTVPIPMSDARAEALSEIAASIRELHDNPPQSLPDLLGIEGRAAQSYWSAWRAVPLGWLGTGRHPIPDDWRYVGS